MTFRVKADSHPAKDRSPIPLINITGQAAEPFPIGVLPGTMRAYVDQAARATNTPPDYTAVPLPVTAAGRGGWATAAGSRLRGLLTTSPRASGPS